MLAAVQRLAPDVVLLDLRMPNMDGMSTLRVLQTVSSKPKVIVLTASEDKSEFVQAMKLGCSGIVLKQTAPELIVVSIRKVNSGEIWLDSHTTVAVMRDFAKSEERLRLEPIRTRERSPLTPREKRPRDRRASGARLQEPRNRGNVVHKRTDGQEPFTQSFRKARSRRPA